MLLLIKWAAFITKQMHLFKKIKKSLHGGISGSKMENLSCLLNGKMTPKWKTCCVCLMAK